MIWSCYLEYELNLLCLKQSIYTFCNDFSFLQHSWSLHLECSTPTFPCILPYSREIVLCVSVGRYRLYMSMTILRYHGSCCWEAGGSSNHMYTTNVFTHRIYADRQIRNSLWACQKSLKDGVLSD